MKKPIVILLVIVSILALLITDIQLNRKDLTGSLTKYSINDDLELKVKPDYTKISSVISSKVDLDNIVKKNKDYEIKVVFDDTSKNTINILDVIANEYKVKYHLEYNKTKYLEKNIFFKDSGILNINKKNLNSLLNKKRINFMMNI